MQARGGKSRNVSVTPELLDELKQYRVGYGLSPLPVQGDTTPLLLPIGCGRKRLCSYSVHMIVKDIFNRTAQRMELRDPGLKARANKLRSASSRWLRYTAERNMVAEGVNLRYVCDNLGRPDLSPMGQYLHSDDDKRARDLEKKHKLDWNADYSRNCEPNSFRVISPKS